MRTWLALVAVVALGCQRRPAAVAAFQDGSADSGQPIPAQFAGLRYPAKGDALNQAIDDLLDKAGRPAPESVLALVVPHAGLQYDGATAAAAFATVRDRRVDKVVILSGAHAMPVSGAVLPQRRAMATPLGDLPIDSTAAGYLATAPGFTRSDAPFRDEQGIEDVLPFIQKSLGTVPIVPLLVGGNLNPAGAKHLAEGLRQILDSRTLLVVSTDLTRYGERFGRTSFGPDASGKNLIALMRQEDELLLDPLLKPDLERFDRLVTKTPDAKPCSADALRVLLALLPPGERGVLRRYSNSNDQDGTVPGEAVSYAGLVYPGSWPDVPPLLPADQQVLLQYARASLAAEIAGAAPPSPPGGGSMRLTERHGVFVTLVKDGEVRACVGRPESDSAVLQTVGEVARLTTTADPRFPPLRREELDQLKIEISVLGPLKPIKRLDLLRLGVDGLYVGLAGHTGLVLPQVANDLKLSLDQFLDAVADRVGVARNLWTPDSLRTFTVALAAEPGAQLSSPSAPASP